MSQLLPPHANCYEYSQLLLTVNVEIFAQYIFSRILCSVLGAQKYDVSEKLNHYSFVFFLLFFSY